MTLTLTIGTLRDGNPAFAFGLDGLTLFIETLRFDAWLGRHGGALSHRSGRRIDLW